MLPKELSKLVPKDHLMSEDEWRQIGVQQSRGWVHYLIHDPGKWRLFVVDYFARFLFLILLFFLLLRTAYTFISSLS
jgi:hypothetical protein